MADSTGIVKTYISHCYALGTLATWFRLRMATRIARSQIPFTYTGCCPLTLRKSECLVPFVERSIYGSSHAEIIRSDNGPELINQSVKDLFGFIDVGTSYIEPGNPSQNGCIESSHSQFLKECLSCAVFGNPAKARHLIALWRNVYDRRRPHCSLGSETLSNSLFLSRTERGQASVDQQCSDSQQQDKLS